MRDPEVVGELLLAVEEGVGLLAVVDNAPKEGKEKDSSDSRIGAVTCSCSPISARGRDKKVGKQSLSVFLEVFEELPLVAVLGRARLVRTHQVLGRHVREHVATEVFRAEVGLVADVAAVVADILMGTLMPAELGGRREGPLA